MLNEEKLRIAIRQYVKQLINEADEEVEVEETETTEEETIEDSGIGMETMPTDDDEMISRFPKLEDALISLMSKDYKTFIKDIKYVAPKPTTFEIDLGENEKFHLTWSGEKMGFVCEVTGKKYWLIYDNELTQASKAIRRLLKQGTTQTEETPEVESSTMDDVPVPAGEESLTPPPGETEGGVSPDEL